MLTTLGEIDESLLDRKETYSEVNGNKLRKTAWHYQGEEVKSSLDVELTQLNIAGEQESLNLQEYPPIVFDSELVTVSLNDAIQILSAIYKSDPNSCIEMFSNIFNLDIENNKKLDFAGKFYINGKEVRISMLPKINNILKQGGMIC